MFSLIQNVFIASLRFIASLSFITSLRDSVSDNRKCIYLNNGWHTLIDLNPDEYNQRLRYYPFMINFDRCSGS